MPHEAFGSIVVSPQAASFVTSSKWATIRNFDPEKYVFLGNRKENEFHASVQYINSLPNRLSDSADLLIRFPTIGTNKNVIFFWFDGIGRLPIFSLSQNDFNILYDSWYLPKISNVINYVLRDIVRESWPYIAGRHYNVENHYIWTFKISKRPFHKIGLLSENTPLQKSSGSDEGGKTYYNAVVRRFIFLIFGYLGGFQLAVWGGNNFYGKRTIISSAIISICTFLCAASLILWVLTIFSWSWDWWF